MSDDATVRRQRPRDVPLVREAHLSEAELLDFEMEALGDAPHEEARQHLNVCAACRSQREQLHTATQIRDPLLGAQLGEYHVEAALARGGMGVVYRGVHPMIGKQVAIKVLSPEIEDGGAVNRLLDEARAVNSIRHPNIIDIFNFGALPDGRHYFVMELLDGESLEEVAQRRHRLTTDEVMTVLEQSMSALGAAHGAGVIHRDLKPANLFLTVLPDQRWHITVLDFGLAKRVGNTRQTSANMVMGTPGFMAPEQIRGLTPVVQTDLYAMGVVAWVLLTGAEPFQAPGIMDLMMAHLNEPLPSLAALVPGAPPRLIALVERLLEKQPEARPATAMDVVAELQQIRAAAVVSAPLARNPARGNPGQVPAGMPSAELHDALAATNQSLVLVRRDAPTQPSMKALESTRRAPARHSRAPVWVALSVLGLAAIGGLIATGAQNARPAQPPPLEQPTLEPLAEVAAPVAEALVPTPPPVGEVTNDAGVAEVRAPTVVAPVLRKPAPDRRKKLSGRLQQLERRFSASVARGESVELELAEVRGLRSGLEKATNERSLDAIETAVERLEGTPR